VAKTIGVAQFKEQCLSLINSLGPEGIVITKHGKPVAKLMPVEAASADLIGAFAAKLKIKGDILSTGASWNAES
jgi:prevent-host-death family protein